MKDKVAIIISVLIFSWMTVGAKGISDYTPSPEFQFVINGSVHAGNGSPSKGVAVFFDLTTSDTSYYSSSYYTVSTNDSGNFSSRLNVSYDYKRGLRINVTNGTDTVKGPWVFTDSASRQEVTQIETSNDCNSHKKIVPVAEIYTFPSQNIIFPY